MILKTRDMGKTTVCFALTALLLAGCSSMPKFLDRTEIIEKPPLPVTKPQQVTQQRVEWRVIEGDGGPFLGMTIPDFKKSEGNDAEMRRYTEQLDDVVDAMKKYYEPAPK